MKNFALTLALLSAAVLSPAATPSPAHAADTLPIASAPDARAACRFLGRFFRGAKSARHDCPCPGTKSP